MVTGAPAVVPPPPVVRSTFGRSVLGRPLRVVRVGPRNARVRVLVVGCIHGNETAGLPVVRRLEHARPPRGTALWLVPSLNPDGQALGSRHDARGVDLNRNFPAAWRPLGPPGSVYYAGSHAASESETRALERLVRRVEPTASVWYHQHLRLVYRQGGARPGLIAGYARRVGLRVAPSPNYPGTVIRWENRTVRRSTAWVVELKAGSLSRGGVIRHARAVLGVARALG